MGFRENEEENNKFGIPKGRMVPFSLQRGDPNPLWALPSLAKNSQNPGIAAWIRHLELSREMWDVEGIWIGTFWRKPHLDSSINHRGIGLDLEFSMRLRTDPVPSITAFPETSPKVDLLPCSQLGIKQH